MPDAINAATTNAHAPTLWAPYTGSPTGYAEDHPLWQKQVELELGMRERGKDRMELRVTRAEERGQASRLGPVRSLMAEWLPDITKGLQAWLTACTKVRGPTPVAAGYLAIRVSSTPASVGSRLGDDAPVTPDVRVPADVASMIALQALLDGIASERIGVMQLACEVGRRVEYEAKIRLWESQAPDLYYGVQRHLDLTDATSDHRARVNINRFNHLMATGQFGFGWVNWGREVQFRVGHALLENIVRITQRFQVEDDPFHVWKHGQKHGPRKVITPKPELMHWIAASLERAGELSPEYRPTIIPPKRWTGTRDGAYWTPYVNAPRLIKFKASQEDQRDAAADEYEALDMPEEYEALHVLQETAWRVNVPVLNVARQLWVWDHGHAGLPRRSETEVLGLTDDAALDPEKVLEKRRERAKAKREDIKRVARVQAADRTLQIATEYAYYDRFYFPHMMDFRGRKYPIPVGLQPQGDDLARGLLEYADPKPILDQEQADWMMIHLASMWGHDKWSYSRRVQWVRDNEEMFRRIAADPLANLEWTEADKPFVSLAICLEYVGFLNEGFGFMSYSPGAVDGTCNGIQHLAAMARDPELGRRVNLLPANSPADIYKYVADKLQPVLQGIELAGGLPGSYATFWLDICNRDLPRSLTKRQVMVMPYGGTLESYIEYTREWLDEHLPVGTKDPSLEEASELTAWLGMLQMSGPKGLAKAAELRARAHQPGNNMPLPLILRGARRSARVYFMAKQMWDVVGDVAAGAMRTMEFLQQCAKRATAHNQPIYWVTPSGFVVRHFYGKQVSRAVTTMLSGERTTLRMTETTKDLDSKAQLQGIAPNFVHSLDAAALTKTILRCKAEGIVSITAVHDAYGCHFADMPRLYHHLRAAFVEVHEHDVLADFRNACMSVQRGILEAEGHDPLDAVQMAEEGMPEVPHRGELDIREVLASDYFFA